jgi:hypothetical protein
MVNLQRAEFAVSWSIIALGAIHIGATPIFVPELGKPALWFAAAGGAFMLVGLINLLALQHRESVPSLSPLCLLVNLVAIVFAVALTAISPVGLGEPTALALVVGALWLSIRRQRTRMNTPHEQGARRSSPTRSQPSPRRS